MHASSYRRWVLAALVLLSLSGMLGCVGAGGGPAGPNIVLGTITPAHFRFKEASSREPGNDPSGWRAVCIHAVMKNQNTDDTTLCKFEVGVPIRSGREGEISLEWAQARCARWANAAAHQVMKQAPPGAMTAVLCIQFRNAYQDLLRTDIQMALVTECRTKGLKPVTFDLFPVDFLSPLP